MRNTVSWKALALCAAALTVSVATPGFSQKEGKAGKEKTKLNETRWKGPIPWYAAFGRPQFQEGRTTGFYMWHDGNDVVHIVTTTQGEKPRAFTGSVEVKNGEILEARGLELNDKDRIRQKGSDALSFRFQTRDKLDGVQFRLKGGTRLHVTMELDGEPTKKIYIGRQATEVHAESFTFDLTKTK